MASDKGKVQENSGNVVIDHAPPPTAQGQSAESHMLVDSAAMLPVLGELAGHGAFAAIMGVAMALVLKKHVVHILHEGVSKTRDSISEVFKNAVQEALEHFRRNVSDGVSQVVGRLTQSVTVAEIDNRTEKHSIALNEALSDIAAERFDEAETKLKELDLKDFDVLQALVTLYRNPKNRRLGDALKILIEMEEVFKDESRFYWELALVYADLGEQKNAIIAANQNLFLSAHGYPMEIKAQISLGYIYFWFDDTSTAIICTEKALSLLKGHEGEQLEFVCKGNLAFYYAELNREADKALQYADDVVAADGNNANYLDTRGYVRMQFLGNDRTELEKARRDFISAGEKDPSLSAAYEHLAEANKRLKSLRHSK